MFQKELIDELFLQLLHIARYLTITVEFLTQGAVLTIALGTVISRAVSPFWCELI